jgi:hypothetical protein
VFDCLLEKLRGVILRGSLAMQSNTWGLDQVWLFPPAGDSGIDICLLVRPSIGNRRRITALACTHARAAAQALYETG